MGGIDQDGSTAAEQESTDITSVQQSQPETDREQD